MVAKSSWNLGCGLLGFDTLVAEAVVGLEFVVASEEVGHMDSTKGNKHDLVERQQLAVAADTEHLEPQVHSLAKRAKQ